MSLSLGLLPLNVFIPVLSVLIPGIKGFVLFCLLFNVPVNSYSHVEMVS